MVLRWVQEVQPRVSIITDGSGRTGASRIASSEKIVRDANATAGPVWGDLSDLAVYEAILAGRIDLFVDLTLKLGRDLEDTPYVAGDAREGVNPTHDLSRMMIDAAVRQVRRTGASIRNFAFFLFASHDTATSEGSIRRPLTAAELEQKLVVARGYKELAAEVDAKVSGTSRKILAQHAGLADMLDTSFGGGESGLSIECLFPADDLPQPHGDRPFYELYGERLAAAGTYPQPIRYLEHVRPIELALAAL